VVGDRVDGLRVTFGDRRLRWGLVVNGLAGVAQAIFTVLFVVFVTRVLGGDGAEVGPLWGVQAIGGLLGGVLVVGLAGRLEPGRLLGTSLLVFAAVDLGRVVATYLGSFNGLMALGMLLAGLGGDAVGVVAVLNTEAGLYLLAGLVAVATLARRAAPGYPRASKRVRMPLA
jgi:Na+/melibiose symporter-like transporter